MYPFSDNSSRLRSLRGLSLLVLLIAAASLMPTTYGLIARAGKGGTASVRSLSQNPGCGSSIFSQALPFDVETFPSSIAVGDFNQDNKPDLAVANGYPLFRQYYVSILLGNGTGGFGSPTNFAVEEEPTAVVVGDFNRDNKLDLAVVKQRSFSISILLGNGRGGFSDPTNFASAFGRVSIAVGDFNLDNNLDLAATGFGSVDVLLGDGKGRFGIPKSFSTGFDSLSVVIGNFNQDGNPDLAVANGSSEVGFRGDVSVLLGDGTGQFGQPTRLDLGANIAWRPTSVVVGDFNRDNKADLAVADSFATPGSVVIFLGNGTGGFSAPVRYFLEKAQFSIAAGDFNRDGKLDLVSTDFGNLSVMFGDGEGKFGQPATFTVGPELRQVVVDDINQDSKLDLVACSGVGKVYALLNTCSPSANTPPTITVAGVITRQEGSPGSVSTIATVSDAETPAGHLTVVASSVPAGITVTGITNNNGAISANVAASCGAKSGANTITLTATDGVSMPSAALTVNVTANTPPSLGAYPSSIAIPGQTKNIQPSAPPSDNGSIARITASAQGFRGNLSVDRATGVVTISNAGPTGDYIVTVTAADNCFAEVTSAFPLKVTPAPDLQVIAIRPLPEALTETPFDLNWTVQNAGSQTATGPWTDKIYISTGTNLSSIIALVASFPFAGPLDPGRTVERIQTITLPRLSIPQDGSYYFIVVTDADNQVNEGSFEENNFKTMPVTIKRKPLPDLIVVPESIQAPATPFFDQTIRVRWTVKNIGAASTDASEWQDWVYLSSDEINEVEDPFKIRVQNVSYLGVGESYVGSADIRIPRGLVGTYNVLIITDYAGGGGFSESPFNVIEDNEKNNRLAKPITISAPPLPDLQVVSSVAASPDEVPAGGQLFLNWRVENKGTGSTPPDQAAWSDGIYLSKDTTFNPATDRLIGSRARSGALVKDDGYAVSSFSVNLPFDVEGEWHVFVAADYQNNVYEFNNEGNNANYDRRRPVKITVIPLDLIVESAVAPTAGTAARQITVNWKIKNRGIADRLASWFDTVYISNEDKFDPAKATPLTTVAQNVKLEAGSVHDGSAQVTLPACNAGRFYLFIFTDSRNNLFEYDPDGKAETNNFSEPKPIQISAIPPDLQVAEVKGFPAIGNAGQPIPVTWTVKNLGGGPTIENGWTDSLYLSESSTLNVNSALLLGSFRREGNLDNNSASYTRTENVVVPTRAQGVYHLFVFTDVGDGVEECASDGNNTRAGATTITIDNKLPDFKITAINFSAPVLSGQTINLSWTGQNAGTADAKNSAWNDKVYLSSKPTLDGSERLLATKLINGPVAVGATYPGQAQVTIPSIPTGDYFLIVASDSDNFVFEGKFENNNTDSRPVRIQSPDVDLRVTMIDAPDQGSSGLQLPISWTVSNAGAAQTFASQWTDRVFISRDRILDATDRAIGYRVREGALNGGASYNATLNVEIPAGLSGPYYIFVRADEHNAVAENNEDNNAAHDPMPVTLQLTPPVDLIVTAVNPPPSGTPGEDATISWTVVNQSNNEAQGRWTDAVYLSSNQVWDINDAEIGRIDRDGPLAGQTTYTATLTAKLPPVTPGNYFIIVRTDVRNRVREEEGKEANNTAASNGTMIVDVPALTLGVPTSSTIRMGQERFYKVNVPGNETLHFTLDGQNSLTSNELFARFGLLPSRSAFDFSFSRPYEPDQEITIPNTQDGTYYSLVRGDYVQASNPPESFSIRADIVPFGLTSVTPNKGGNFGKVTVSLQGGQLLSLKQAQLLGGDSIVAERVVLISDSLAYATFDLRDKAVGLYSLEITRGDLSYDFSTGVVREVTDKAVLANCFSILTGVEQKPELKLILPKAVRPGRVFPVTIYFTNHGLTDVPSPWLQVVARGGKVRLSEYTGSVQLYRKTVDLLALNQNGMAGILQPGASGFVTLDAMPDKGSQLVNISLRSNHANSSVVNYDRLYELAGKPYDAEVWKKFVALTGSTWKDFLNSLSIESNRYQTSEMKIYDPYELINVILDRVSSEGEILSASSSSGVSVDVGRQYKLIQPTHSLSGSINVGPLSNQAASSDFLCSPDPSYCTTLTLATLAVNELPLVARYHSGRISSFFFNLWLKRQMPPVYTPPSNLGVEDAVKRSPTFQLVNRELTNYIKRYIQTLPTDELCVAGETITLDLAAGVPGKLPPLAREKVPEPAVSGWWQSLGATLRIIGFDRNKERDLFLTFGSRADFYVPNIIKAHIKRQGKKITILTDINITLYDVYDFNNNRVPTIIDPPQPVHLEANKLKRYVQSAYVLEKCCNFTGSRVVMFLGDVKVESIIDTECECDTPTDECDKCPGTECDDDDEEDVGVTPPQDPNEKLSGVGYGPQAFIPLQLTVPYTINFENLPAAQGFAQQVRITDQVSNNLDWRTFRLKEIGFGKYRIQVPENRAFYQSRIQLGEDLGNLLADISVGIDIATGQVTWTLTAIDPNTGEQPNSASLGLLPPNDQTGRGQGYVTYTVQPKAGLPTGTQISNKATIIFDTEEPITTNTVTNTLDADAPVSTVNALPLSSSTTFTLSWSGSDPAGGSELQSFDIWVSENDGPYQPFLSGATDTSAQFTGQPGRAYRFYSIARDNAGNVEAAPAQADAVTTVQNPVPTFTSLTPNSAQACGAAFTLTVNGTNFVNGATVNWNGTARPTMFVSATQLTAAIPAGDIAAAGMVNVTVVNPAPGGGASNALTFTITQPPPPPTIASISPSSAMAGGAAFTLTVNGANFTNASKVSWGGKELATTFVSATQLTAQVSAAEITSVGTAQVTVSNSGPCGGTSNAVTFTINPPLTPYEADVAPRPNVDGEITAADWDQAGRFVTGLDTPAEGSEFQRADCAPRSGLGDGRITLADWVQAGRYAAGFDAKTQAGGATKAATAFALETTGYLAAAAGRVLRIGNTTFQRGQVNSLQIEMDALGNENAVAFTLNYDPALMSFSEAVLGQGLSEAKLYVNATRAASGQIGIAFALPAGKVISLGTAGILTLRLLPTGGANNAITKVSFGDQLIKSEVVDAQASAITDTTFSEGAVLVTGRAIANVSAADYSGPALAAESIAAAFGTELATTTEEAKELPLPTTLGGTTVKVKDSKDVERPSPLFFVAPQQVNYLIPPGTAEGIATVTITSANGVASAGLIQVTKTSPGLFSADSSGRGLAAAYVVRVKPDGTQINEPVVRFDPATNKFIAVPIDLSPESEQVFLVMFGTGIRNRDSLADVKAVIGGVDCPVEYAGAQGTFVGLDQINVRLLRSLAGRGEAEVDLKVHDQMANKTKINIK